MKSQWLRLGLEELKFVQSPDDLKILLRNAKYGLSRAIGTIARHTRVPHSVQIEPTNCCNLACICCPRSKSSRARGYMDFSLFRRIIDDASQIGVKMARLYLHGEPMLHPQMVEMFSYVKRKGMVIHLVTNGTLFTRDRSKAILNSNVNRADRIIFSILGYSKEVHERIMRGVDHYQVLKDLSLFLELRKEMGLNGPVIEVIFYVMPENESERWEFYEYWHGVVDHVQVVGWTSKQFAGFNSAHHDSVPVRSKTCTYLWDRMTIFWNGDVTTCMADVDGIHRFGNLSEQSISEVWNCQTILSIKQLHKKRLFQDLPFCSRCDW